MSRLERLLFVVNLIIYLFLVIFSYAYVDLNLTLSKIPLAINFVSIMQRLGYFNRPLATLIYFTFIITAFSFFIYNLWLFHKAKIGLNYLRISTIGNTFILIFAYPFLSADLFNYLFDAKIILKYHLSPYSHRPLDFPQDDWLRFMRWIHRYSPYGPVWLGMSLVPAVFGFGKFILNFLFFKIFISFFHLLNAFIIYKTLKKINPSLSLFGTAFYSLNPLFLIEGVVNAHNDVVLATFMLTTIYFWAYGKRFPSYLMLFLGTFVKYIPALNLPWLFLASLFKKPLDTKGIILLNLITMAIFTYLFSSFKITVPFVSSGSTQVQFQPWYLFWTLPFVGLLPKIGLIIVSVVFSFGAALRYLPYLYFGDWSWQYVITFMQSVTIIPVVIAGLGIVWLKFSR